MLLFLQTDPRETLLQKSHPAAPSLPSPPPPLSSPLLSLPPCSHLPSPSPSDPLHLPPSPIPAAARSRRIRIRCGARLEGRGACRPPTAWLLQRMEPSDGRRMPRSPPARPRAVSPSPWMRRKRDLPRLTVRRWRTGAAERVGRAPRRATEGQAQHRQLPRAATHVVVELGRMFKVFDNLRASRGVSPISLPLLLPRAALSISPSLSALLLPPSSSPGR